MTLEIALLFGIIIAMIALMAWEKLPTDTLAVTVMVVLITHLVDSAALFQLIDSQHSLSRLESKLAD